MASTSRWIVLAAIVGFTAGGAFAQTTSSPTPHKHSAQPQDQVQLGTPTSDDTTLPGTGAADLRRSPIVGGKNLQPRPNGPPTQQENQQINQLLQQTPPDSKANGPIVQPRDLFGNPLGGSPTIDQKKP
ncbi:hypothetical protein [Aliidongia dinghuensis]|uniref:hypothetical protein n=1 Tax=Aliidongia dinghuensis TaxID=1867774 RepID=UPI001668CD22|nr:hypothetical protein [Aliidongia dinghuensis]